MLSNINTAGNEDAHIRYSGTQRIATRAIWLTLKNVEISGLGRGIGISVPEPPVVQGQTPKPIKSFRIMVEDSSLSDLSVEAIRVVAGRDGGSRKRRDPDHQSRGRPAR